jgi:hypothetical protein
MTFDIGEFNEILSHQFHFNLHHAVLTATLYEDMCFCKYLEHSSVNIYWSEKYFEKSYKDKRKDILYVQLIFSVSLIVCKRIKVI